MNASALVCKNEQRRYQVRQKEGLNGLDYLEVSEDQLVLTVFFLGKAPPQLEKENIRIEGGQRITDIQVVGLEIHQVEDPETDDCVHIYVNKPGDFSTYSLCLVEIDAKTRKPVVDVEIDDPHTIKNCGVNASLFPTLSLRERGRHAASDSCVANNHSRKHFRPMHGFDPRYACLEFNFKTGCPSDLDCKPQSPCPPEKRQEPEINYLAKDYAGFRQLLLDRMALTMPDWKERHVPDFGITLLELFAYAGDHLSYYQDAVATEAYLDTARRRVSVRRHVRLVDYQLHEGCNARAWVVFKVSRNLTSLNPDDFYLITDPDSPINETVLDHNKLSHASLQSYLIFEPLVEDREQDIAFYEDHNEISLYTWGDCQCCLPKGANSATLLDQGTATPPKPGNPDECGDHDDKHYPKKEQTAPSPLDTDYRLKLKPCDVLIFAEVKGPRTGNPADADPSHRHAVRLTKAKKSQDPLNGQLIWEIEWTPEDALPFPLCISSSTQTDCSPIAKVSVVYGNVLLVDHGSQAIDEWDPVPVESEITDCGDTCRPRETIKIAGRFKPYLSKPDVTFSQALPPCIKKNHAVTPANVLLKQDIRLALPFVTLQEVPLAFAQDAVTDPPHWEPRLDLLGSGPEERHFVVEIEEDRRAQLRFGNGESGRFPDAGTQFRAVYRTGNGAAGNIGAGTINHIVFRKNLPNGVAIGLSNPLPATGGTNPEPIIEAKLFAPNSFRKELQRAITADDYARIVIRDFSHKVQRAAATLRWTGSWFEVLVAIDPLGTEAANEELLCTIKHHLCRYRRIGHDVVVVQASYVALDIAMAICVLPHYLRGHVKAELLDIFSSGTMLTGGKGFFHPDNLSFGEGIYLSKLVATAQAAVGVESVVVTKLERFFEGQNKEIEDGFLPLGSFEVARLDNDPSFPENGRFTLELRGGR